MTSPQKDMLDSLGTTSTRQDLSDTTSTAAGEAATSPSISSPASEEDDVKLPSSSTSTGGLTIDGDDPQQLAVDSSTIVASSQDSDGSGVVSTALMRRPCGHRHSTLKLCSDMLGEIVSYLHVTSKSASNVALTSKLLYTALSYQFEPHKKYQLQFGLPTSQLIVKVPYKILNSREHAVASVKGHLRTLPIEDFSKISHLAAFHHLDYYSREGIASLTSRIPQCFLGHQRSLVSVNLAGMISVEEIGPFFLTGCRSLTIVNLEGMSSLQKIPFGFLSDCSSLVSVNLAGMISVEKIGPCFISSCPYLTTLNLEGMTSVKEIGYHFLEGSKQRLSEAELSRMPPALGAAVEEGK